MRTDSPKSVEQFEEILSHDLTNHLNVIDGHVDMLIERTGDPETLDHLETIRRQATAAEALLRTIGGIVRGGDEEESNSVDVTRLLSREVDRLRTIHSDATIDADLDDDVVALADDLLLSVFTNLLENAIHHNPSRTPTVFVRATTEDDSVIVTVEDDGPGLPDEARDQLLGRSIPHPKSGLHVVSTLIRWYDGTIFVSTSEGGSRVTIELPRGDGSPSES